LFKEVKRVLKKKGKLVIVNSKKPIDDFYRTKEVKHITDFSKLLKDFDFKVKEKEVLGKRILFVKALPL
jgi:ubiquinone/menaquinone biosynthesis C-methylase UbiE